MFRSQILWDSSEDIQLYASRKIRDLSGIWNSKWAKLKVEETPTVGSTSTQWCMYGEILLYQFTTFINLVESDGSLNAKSF